MKPKHILLFVLPLLFVTALILMRQSQRSVPPAVLPAAKTPVVPDGVSPANAAASPAPSAVAGVGAKEAALASFAAWLRGFDPASATPTVVAEGQRLAAARQPVMLELMRENPRAALERSLKWNEWAALPAEIQALVEKPFSSRADFSVISDDRPEGARGGHLQTRFLSLAGGSFDALVYGRRTHLSTKLATPLQGITLSGQAALWESPVYRLEGVELAAAQDRFPDGNPRNRSWVTGAQLQGETKAALIGGKLHYFASDEEVARVAQVIARAEAELSPHSISAAWAAASGGGAAGAIFDSEQFLVAARAAKSAWTEQAKRVLAIRLAYTDVACPYTSNFLSTNLLHTSNTIRQLSFAKTWLVPTVTSNVITLPNNKAYYEATNNDTLALDARNGAQAAGYNPTNFDIFVYCFPALARISPTPAFANLGGQNFWLNGDTRPTVYVHEFGHTYGLDHANSWRNYLGGFNEHKHPFGDIIEHQEYGDPFDLMAADFASIGSQPLYPNGHFSMRGKSILNWIETNEVVNVMTSGVYRLRRFDDINARATPGGTLGLKVLNRIGDELWLGYRRNFTNTAPGAYIVWGNTPLAHRFLDATPLSQGANFDPQDKQDGILTAGQTFMDPSGTVRLKMLNNGGSAPNEYIDVEVTLLQSQPARGDLFDLYTAPNLATNGLVGSYVDSMLFSVNTLDWRTTPGVTISGTRVDPSIEFSSNGWGPRASVGLTSGTDTNWDFFSVQWDGFIRVKEPVRLATISDETSRMWIDANANGVFEASELCNNDWGFAQTVKAGNFSGLLVPGTYAIRIQYFEQIDDNSFGLVTGDRARAFEIYADANNLTNGLVGSLVNVSLRNYSPQDDWRTSQTIASTRIFTNINFLTNGWGTRPPGITGGSNENWEGFSVQWDGWLRVFTPTRFATISDDGSRMWIDVNSNGTFASTAPEFINNGWGAGQGDTLGQVSPLIAPGNYRVRIQYEDLNVANHFLLTGTQGELPQYTVTTLAESGPGSLRDAINLANAAGQPATISLAVTGTVRRLPGSPFPTFTNSISFLGPGTNLLTIDGIATNGVAGGLFRIAAGTTNLIRGVRLANAGTGSAASALINNGSTILENCLVENCAGSFGFGGAIQNTVAGRLSATNCVFLNNRTTGGQGVNRGPGNNGGPGGGGAGMGGAIYSDGTLTLSGCAFVNNVATGGNGGNGDGNGFNDDAGGNGGGPNPGTGGAVGQPGGAGGYGGGGGGGAGSALTGFAGGVGGFGGGGGAGGARGIGGNGGSAGAGGLYGGAAGVSLSSHSGGGGGGAGIGGAIYAQLGPVTIVNCSFTGNLATNGVGGVGSFGLGNGANGQGVGGAVYINSGVTLTTSGNTFSGNIASTSDPNAAVSTLVTTLLDSGFGSLRLAVANASFVPGPNTVTFATNLSGGLIVLSSAQIGIDDPSGVTITATNLPLGLTISGGTSRRIFRVAPGSTVALDTLHLTGGSIASGSGVEGADGGAILNYGNLTVNRCTFSGNAARFGGAIDCESPGTLTLDHCTLTANSATVFGGAMWMSGGPTIRHCTISGNTGASAPGGLQFGINATLLHSIVAGNSGGSNPDIAAVQPFASAQFNLIGNGAGSGLINGVNGNIVGTNGAVMNPGLGPLNNNGGPTPTMQPRASSRAVDGGDPMLSGFGFTDQRGFARVVNGRIDIGAVEGSLRTYFSFDSSSISDAMATCSPQYSGFTGPFAVTDHRGRASSALGLNDPGTDNYVNLITTYDIFNSNRGLGMKGDFTVSAWIYPRAISAWKILLGNDGPGGPGTLHFGLYGQNVHMSFWDNYITGGKTIPVNQWTHVAWTYNSLGGQMAIYVNGQLDASAVGRPNTVGDHNLLLGFCPSIAGSQFSGWIDEFAIFGEALSASQISALAATNGMFPNSALPQPVLSPGLAATSCGWNVREVWSHTNDSTVMPGDLPSALHVANTPQFGRVTNYTSSVINRVDFDLTPCCPGPFITNAISFAGNTPADDDHFVLAASTTLHITEEDDYTFGFASDDGASLRILGSVFSSSTRIDTANPANPAHRGDTLIHPGATANSTTLGVTHLKPGDYPVEFLYYEIGGGAHVEVFAARGARTSLSVQPLSIPNTGLDAAEQPLAAGATDPHYQLVVNPDGGSSDARVHSEVFPIAPNGPWLANSQTSKWVSSRADSADAANGDYTYRLNVDLTDRDLPSVRLTGRWATDNAARIRVNGVDTAFTNTAEFLAWTPFVLDPTTVPLVRGLNAIDFVVNNAAPGWTGLRVEFTEVIAPNLGFTLLSGSMSGRPALTIRPSGNPAGMQLNWSPSSACDRLQFAPSITGPWDDVPNGTNGVVLPVNPGAMFFRLTQ